jgi:hypothetical protein
MRKSIITILSVMLMALFIGTAFADPWITDGDTATARYNIDIPDGYNLTAHDATFGGAISVGAGTISGGVYDGNLSVAGTHTFKVIGGPATFGSSLTAASLVSNTTITGEQVTSTDDALITDDLIVDGGARIDETATVNALVSNTTVSSAVDGFLANSVIVPTYETITIPIGAGSADEYVFVADDAWWLVKAEEVHSAAGSEVAPIAANLTIRICDDAEAVTGGVNSTITVIPLNDAANTINTASLNSANSILADGDMIAFDYAGTLTGLRGSVTLTLRRM